MLPQRILETFARVPEEVVDLCRPHPWPLLSKPPQDGMRPIRDILVHMISAERNWIRHVIHGDPRERLDPNSFPDLDSILKPWHAQRAATLEFLGNLTPDRRQERRPFPWDAKQTTSLGEIVWHVVTHEQYHRGQVFTRLAMLGRRDLPDYDLLR